jgi:hypothetical protein
MVRLAVADPPPPRLTKPEDVGDFGNAPMGKALIFGVEDE